jgi:hypothetical protein
LVYDKFRFRHNSISVWKLRIISNYSKVGKGQREISLAAEDKIAGYFNISIDELIHMGDDIPKEISLEDKTTVEQVKLIPSAAKGLPTAGRNWTLKKKTWSSK